MKGIEPCELTGLSVFACLALFAFAGRYTSANAQSVEEAYDATLDAYNKTLDQLKKCDQSNQERESYAQNQE